MIFWISRKEKRLDFCKVAVRIPVRVQLLDTQESLLIPTRKLVSLSIPIQRNLPVRRLKAIADVAVIAASIIASFSTLGNVSPWMAHRAVVELGGLGERIGI
jgi:hypothetical protein